MFYHCFPPVLYAFKRINIYHLIPSYCFFVSVLILPLIPKKQKNEVSKSKSCFRSQKRSCQGQDHPAKLWRIKKILVLSHGNRLRTIITRGILRYFEVTHADRTATAILLYLDEKDLSEEERRSKHLQSTGFYPPTSIHVSIAW